MRLRRRDGFAFSAHDRTEFAGRLVVLKQGLGQGALVAQHIDQEAQCAQAVAQLFKYAGSRGSGVHGVDHELLHAAAYTQCGQCRLVQPQHRKNSAHLRQLTGHFAQGGLVAGVAEKLIERLFHIVQGAAQLIDHAAHGLALTDPPVEVLHPGLQRFGCAAGHDALQALRQARAALSHLVVSGVQIVVGGLKVQHRCGHFHGQSRRRRSARAGRGIDCRGQGAGKPAALAVQFDNHIRHRSELLCSGLQTVQVATGQRRPSFGSGGNPLACQHQKGGVEAAELLVRVVHRTAVGQPVSLPHGRHHGRLPGINRNSPRAEKHNVLCQPLGHRAAALGLRHILLQDAGCGLFGVDVTFKKLLRDAFEIGGAQHPKGLLLARRCCRSEAHTQCLQPARRCQVLVFHQAQDGVVHLAPHLGAHRARHGTFGHSNGLPLPAGDPEICRMDAISAAQIEQGLVLREQRDRRSRFALEQAFQIFVKREAGALEATCDGVVAQLGALHTFLRQGLHRPQKLGGRLQPDHLQRAHRLVQLLAGDAQVARVEQAGVRAVGQLGIAHKATHRLGRAIQRLVQLFQNPRQRPQICLRERLAFGSDKL